MSNVKNVVHYNRGSFSTKSKYALKVNEVNYFRILKCFQSIIYYVIETFLAKKNEQEHTSLLIIKS